MERKLFVFSAWLLGLNLAEVDSGTQLRISGAATIKQPGQTQDKVIVKFKSDVPERLIDRIRLIWFEELKTTEHGK